MGRLRVLHPCAVVAAAALLLGGCSEDSPSLLDGKGTESSRIAGLWWLMFAMAAVVYVVVAGFVLVAIARGRRRAPDGDDGGARDDVFIWVGGLALPVVVLSILGVVTVTTTRAVRPVASGAVQIEVIGERWWWDVSYPDENVRTANEIRVPVGQPVEVTLTSDNVAHSFWVPQLAGKVDLIPGQPNVLRFEATEAGTYRGECAEFCGIQHANMNFVVIAEEPQDFQRWLARRGSGAGTTPTDELAAQGQRVFQSQPCAGCHAIEGTAATGTIGPDLSDFGARQTIGALAVPNNPENLAEWITDSQEIKPGNLMPPIELSPDQVTQLVAYLEGLG